MLRPAARRLAAVGIGFAGGWAVLYGALMPFGLGLTLGLAEDCFAPCAAGAALGLLLHGLGALSLRSLCQLCALGAAVAARWLLPQKFVPAALAGCGTLTGMALCFALGSSGGADLLLYSAADALLAAVIGFGLRRFAPERPGMGTLLVGAAVAAALGSATAAAVVLAPGRRVETLAAYAGGCVSGVLCVQPPGNAFGLLFSACGGMAVVCLLPGGWLAPVADTPQSGENTPAPARSAAASTRLEAVAQSLSSLAETVNAVYEGLPRRREGFRWVIDNVHDTLCFNCGRRETCWKQEYTATMAGMEALRPLLEQNGSVETAQLPGELSRCIHPAALCAAAGRSFALYRSRKEARIHSEAMRTALTEQYSAVAEALGVLSEQLGRPGDPEPYKSSRVAEFFTGLGAPPQECAVTLDDLGRTHAAVTLPRTRFGPQELAALARRKKVFLFEAMTTQYLENYNKIRELLPRIGRVKLVQCNFSQYSSRYDAFCAGETPVSFDPECAGGALMDLNVYNISYIVGLFGEPNQVHYLANMERGIDTSGILTMEYNSFKAVSMAAKDCGAPARYVIQGTKGYILQKSTANWCGGVTFHPNQGKEEHFNLNGGRPRQAAEFHAFARAIEGGDQELCSRMLDTSVAVSRVLTVARRSAGIKFPCDR